MADESGGHLEELGTSTDRFHAFQDLIQNRVQDVLLVGTLYDYYTLSQEGRLNGHFLSEFLELNLRHTPSIARVFSARDAIEFARETSRYDVGLGNERNDAHFAAAILANQRVGLEHTSDQVGPTSAQGFTLGGVELVVIVCGWFFAESFLVRRE